MLLRVSLRHSLTNVGEIASPTTSKVAAAPNTALPLASRVRYYVARNLKQSNEGNDHD
jgi:hypothetical protein